jgi:hypothetical protein
VSEREREPRNIIYYFKIKKLFEIIFFVCLLFCFVLFLYICEC